MITPTEFYQFMILFLFGLVLVLFGAIGTRESGLIIKPGRNYQESWAASIYTLVVSVLCLILGLLLLFGVIW